MRTAFLYLGIICVAAAFGCSEGPVNLAATVTDSAGIIVVVNPQTEWAPMGGWRVEVTPALDIGGSSADSNYQFFRVRSCLRLADERLAVANAGSYQIRFFDPVGHFSNAVGRKGGGPGEFEHITWAQKYRGDSILVFDRRLVRLSLFDSAGQLGRTVTLRDDDGRTVIGAVGAFGDGTFLAVAETVPELSEPGVFRPVWNLFRADAEGRVHDSLGTYIGEESFFHVSPSGGAMDSRRLFARKTEFAVTGDQFYAGFTENFEIHKHSSLGRLLASVRRGFSPVNVSEVEVSLLKDRQLDAVRHIEHLRDRVEEFLDAMPLPKTLPAFGPLLVDEVGNLWVQEYAPPSHDERRWNVFGANGALLAMLETPPGFEPLHIDENFLLGRWVDETGEEYVRLYRLFKS